MEDTKVLLDENTHNVRHLQFLSKDPTRSKLKLVLKKVSTQTTKVLAHQNIIGASCGFVEQENFGIRKLCKALATILTGLLITLAFVYLLSRTFSIEDHVIRTMRKNGPVDTDGRTSELSNDDNYFRTIPMVYNNNTRWIVSSKKCHVPNIDPWHENAKGYAKISSPLDCSEFVDDKALTFVLDNKLYFYEDTSKNYSDCCYKRVKRIENDRKLKLDIKCHPIHINGTEIKHELVRVRCENANYTSVHSFVYAEREEEQKLEDLINKKVNLDGYYNVLFIGIDTMSRLNMYRQMNETLNVLRTEYKMLEFLGYSKVGENTFPNLVPLLSGQSPEQLAAGCWNTTYENESGSDIFDNCRFLWNIYARYGYRTLYNEDWPDASTFNYLKPGFKVKPTLLYGRPWHLLSQREQISHSKKGSSSCYDCIHNQLALDVYLNHLDDYIRIYRHKPHFAFQWINCPQHDDINGASKIDGRFAKFFRQIKKSTSERTFIIFFSDHGYRWGSFLDTYMGHQEASMPFLSMSVPRLFQLEHPDLLNNLMEARNTMITPYDLYKTMLDMLSIGLRPKESTDTDINEAKESFTFNYDQSLKEDLSIVDNNNFSSISVLRLPKSYANSIERNCDEAGIPDNYCVCNTFVDVSTKSSRVKASAWFLMEHINDKLKPETSVCSRLTLNLIMSAKEYRLVTTNENMKKAEPKAEYEIKIRTYPGKAIFQEVVRVYGDLNECQSVITGGGQSKDINLWNNDTVFTHKLQEVCKFSIHSQSISRLNLYGNQSECLTHSNAELKKMCYCKKFLSISAPISI